MEDKTKTQGKLKTEVTKLNTKQRVKQGEGMQRISSQKRVTRIHEKASPSNKLRTEANTKSKLQVEKKRQGKFVEEKLNPQKVDSKFREALRKPSTVMAHQVATDLRNETLGMDDENIDVSTLKVMERVQEKAIYQIKSYEKLSETSANQKLSKESRFQKFRTENTTSTNHSLEKKSNNFRFKKNSQTNPNAPSEQSVAKTQQKKQIKRTYAQRFRKLNRNTVAVKSKASQVMGKLFESLKSNPKVLMICAIGFAFVILISCMFSSCTLLGGATIASTSATTHNSEDEDILEVEASYVAKETALQSKIDNIETTNSGYDEYRYNLVEIGHDPFELAAFLTAKYLSYTLEMVREDLETIFAKQYTLTLTPSTETRTDSEGNSYTWKILTITLTNTPISSFAEELLTPDQYELYQILVETMGNKPDIFGDYLGGSGAVGDVDFQIPDHYLEDDDFAKVYAEAIKYLGYPYCWGGQSPATSFDCSGLMYWIYNATGVYSHSRLTAQGYYNLCTKFDKDQRQAGDFIFFTGTGTHATISHIAMYIGDGMMIHSANAGVSFASIDTGYWATSGTYVCYGRLPI